jgi:PTS system nitrogen regulatory IIA component
MQLSLRDVARLFAVREADVHGWVRQGELPAHEINGQYRFNRVELLEWATAHKLPVPAALLQENGGDVPSALLRLDRALELGKVVHNLPGADRDSVLKALVEALPQASGLDRDFLLQIFLNRESLGSTAVGNGIAIPHPRYPIVLPVRQPAITLCFLAQPVPYGAADGQPVHTLFALTSPSARIHLQMLARLALALRDEGFRKAVEGRASAEALLAEARRVEETLRASSHKTD